MDGPALDDGSHGPARSTPNASRAGAPKSATAFFERPLFNDPAIRALEQVGVIDVGSNSVRMVVFDGAARSPAYFFNEKVLCGLGRGLATTGALNPEGRVRAMAAIRRFTLLAKGMNLQNLTMVATAAMREATDGPAFQAEVEAATKLRMLVIDGTEEARLSAQGVLTGWPEAAGLVCDIGGSSMELAEISEGTVHRCVTSPLGPFRLQQVKGGKKGMKTHVSNILKDLREQIGTHYDALYLVGGSWRALARLDMERRGYPLTVLHEYEMTPKSIRKTLDWIADNDLKALRAATSISAERISLVPLAAVVLRQMLAVFRPRHIYISSYGIREGILYDQMPDVLRSRDPLIEACRFSEHTNARMPGFGRKLFNFLLPLYKSAPTAKLRLMKAACLLHDVNWRAHPDYRAQACFDTATRANLGGLDHKGRIYLGLALMYRYKTSGIEDRMVAVSKLLSDDEIREAQMLGRAMRFGAMFSMDGPENAGELRFFPKKRVLELVLRPQTQALFSEVAEARFSSLAKVLDVKTIVRVSRNYSSSGASGSGGEGGAGSS
ncbi:Ppx/GppA family phosphatase [Roseicitreum antarcticum]|uniref:Exopolyphosphatase / guanosine-5'-triphosphate,3'-diphosphate pyrophosphatase n=1 Tax=Roseicitreum antarcticum TaxID=564137 RepID=A0A1H2VUW0_9RHOB|nr:Ppx/GppA family phosphatase [Roseicitreum antarcticum]SDW72192.1 exopolyphosphatase / guanosine-5'-triphosphate,3'-diphosphate pyrophosphatase [Roseicitreum antarcticum]